MKSSPLIEPTSSGGCSRDDRLNESTNDLAQGNYRSQEEKRAFGGLIVRRYRWSLSLKGKLLVLLSLATLALIALFGLYPFLAVTETVDANVLVVEGWVHPYAIQAGADEFRSHHYRKIFTTGGPVIGRGGYVNDYQTSASAGAYLLKKTGIPEELIQMVPSHVIGRDRTYSSAIALRDWFRTHGVEVQSLNIVTEGTHARRTRLLFEKALGPAVKVGIIAVPNPDFDARRWWLYSEGAEDVVEEAIGYIYARFLFHPTAADAERIRG